MEQQNYINSVNLNQNTDFPYLVLNIVNDNSYCSATRFLRNSDRIIEKK